MSKSEFSEELEVLGVVLGALATLKQEQQKFVLNTVMERLSLKEIATFNRVESGVSDSVEETKIVGQISPKEFLKRKQPASFIEQIACLAYYLTHYRDTHQFKTVDLTKLNQEAGGQRMSNPAAFARDAVSQAGYLTTAGGGKKQITSRGESVVEALPDREKMKAELDRHPLRARKRSKNKKGGLDDK